MNTTLPAASPPPGDQPASDAAKAAAVALTVSIASTADGTPQKALFYAPPEADQPAPLLVALHTWGYGYEQCMEYWPHARERGWAMIAPNFRGRNERPEACASALAIQDVLDAVAYVRRAANIDAARIYVTGMSGGGHMGLMLAASAPQLWAGVSSWVPIADLAAWHAENVASKRTYWILLDKCCGGPPSAATLAEYRARSPLFHLAAAQGLPIDLNAGIHDGHTGSVPISHTLRAFNVLAAANGLPEKRLSDDEIALMVSQEKVPATLAAEGETDAARRMAVLFRRAAGPVQVTIFEGSHEHEIPAALDWLAQQKRAVPADS